jgi:hypothetical protein
VRGRMTANRLPEAPHEGPLLAVLTHWRRSPPRCPFTRPKDLRCLIHTREREPKAQERSLNDAATTHAEVANSTFTTSSDH